MYVYVFCVLLISTQFTLPKYSEHANRSISVSLWCYGHEPDHCNWKYFCVLCDQELSSKHALVADAYADMKDLAERILIHRIEEFLYVSAPEVTLRISSQKILCTFNSCE